MGAILASEEVGNAFEPGDHAATFGGGPLACAAGLASIETIKEEDWWLSPVKTELTLKMS